SDVCSSDLEAFACQSAAVALAKMRSSGQTARRQDSRTRSNAESQTRRLLWLRPDLAADIRAILRPNVASQRAAWLRDERHVREPFRDRGDSISFGRHD